MTQIVNAQRASTARTMKPMIPLKHWDVPDVAPDEKSFGNRSTAFGTPLAELYRKKMGKSPNPMSRKNLSYLRSTMAELERIRQDAFEEG